MKAQFATFEALAVAFVVIFSMAFASTAISSYASSQYYSLEHLHLAFAEHDFMAAEGSNTSLSSCTISYLENGSSCMVYYTAYYSKLYGLNGFNVSAPASYTSGESCFPVLNSTRLLCLGD